MTAWTTEQVGAVAPDASSMAAARKLARPGPWSDTGANDVLVWGRCQGSGREPYQVSVDVAGPAYRCSCPSRKIPCKHVLALLLLWAEGGGLVSAGAAAADFAQEWADGRAGRAARRADRSQRAVDGDGAEDAKGTDDAAAAARRLENRMALMAAGADDLSLWLEDLVRGGLAAARRRPISWWSATAARLVDAQLPGLADQVRRIGSEVNRREQWVEPLLADLGLLWAAAQAWRRREALDAETSGDLRAVVGWAVPTEQVRAAERLSDTWTVLGAHRTESGRPAEQRTWLRAENTGDVVEVLDFAAGGQALPVARLAGARLAADVARYPGSGVRRGLFVTEPRVVGEASALPAGGDLADAAAARAEALARNPWLPRVPVLLRSVRLHADPVADRDAGVRLRVVDDGGRHLPLADEPDPWGLVAAAGGAAVDAFAELEDGVVRVLSASGLPGAGGVVSA